MKIRGWVYSLVVILCLGAGWANGQDTIYVSRDGLCGGYNPCYSTIQDAIDSVSLPSIIKITQETYYEDVVLDVNQVIDLEGGWDTSFTSCSSYTMISGSMMMSDGTMIIGGTGRIIISTTPPMINSFFANPGAIVFGQSTTLSWSITNATSASIDQGVGSVNSVGGSIIVSPATTTIYTLTASNAMGSDMAQVTVNVIPSNLPIINSFSGNPGTIDFGQSTTLSWSITNATSASIDQGIGDVDPTSGSTGVSPAATTTYTLTAANGNGAVTSQATVTVVGGLPPDPGTVAPPLDPTVATTVATATEFIYTGANPIQTGVAPGTIDSKRVAVLRGKVLDRNGQPLPGVTITILNHPEYGQTLSRLDGMFDMVVNGGGLLIVNYEKQGYLTAQRQKDIPWQEFMRFPEVRMIQADDNVNLIDLTKTDDFQLIRGSLISDERGERRATVLIPKGVQAWMVFKDGHEEPISSLTVRATEYTVGPSGPETMPAELPPTSAYTFCEEFTVEEAVAAGAPEVRFSQPVISYNENFLNFPVGTGIPLGAYNRERGVWIPSDNGKVIKIINITNELAELDTDGNEIIDNGVSIGITDAERHALAGLYQAGQTLWRVLVPHFTRPWDCNMSVMCDEPCYEPKSDSPFEKEPVCVDEQTGSIIECQSQVLAEDVPITGTPYYLNYQSDRARGRAEKYQINIPITGSSISPTLQTALLEIEVAGRKIELKYNPATNLKETFTWDGKDVYGRVVQGVHPIRVRIGYLYKLVYGGAGRFAVPGNGIQISVSSNYLILWQVHKGMIGAWDAKSQGLGGWTLNVHHAYEPAGMVANLGYGGTQGGAGRVIKTVAGTGAAGYSGDGGPAVEADLHQPRGIPVGPDGTFYTAEAHNHRVRRVGPDGIITTVAGTGGNGYSGDGGPAINANLSYPMDVAIGPDGSVYIADYLNHRIRRVGTDGIITTVAGTGVGGYSGDWGPAINAQLHNPWALTVGPDGSLYIADGGALIRRVGPDGIITTIAGTIADGYSGDGGPAINAQLYDPYDLAVGPDGSLYIADSRNNRIRRVGPDGIITTIAGTGLAGFSGDGGPATNATLSRPMGIAISPDGNLYISDIDNRRVRQVTSGGTIMTCAGSGIGCVIPFVSGDGGPPTNAQLCHIESVSVGPDRSLYIADVGNGRVRRVLSAYPGVGPGDITLASDDGSDLYVFNGAGLHIRTVDALTGAVRYDFTYDSANRLITITDESGNTTTIQRDIQGNPAAIIAPHGQQTTLSFNANGYLASIANPAGEMNQYGYTNDGLLIALTNPRDFTYTFGYDTLGLLTRDTDPRGGWKSLSRTEITNGYDITLTTAMGRNTNYSVENLPIGDQRQTTTFPDGTSSIALHKTDESTTLTLPDGTVATTMLGPDPRFGMESPLLKSMTVTTPGGLALDLGMSRTVNLTDPENPLSIVTLTDATTQNGKTYTKAYDAATKTFTYTTPVGRQSTMKIDSLGRIIEQEISGLNAVQYSYDAQGHLSGMSRGLANEARNFVFQYNPEGYLGSITDSLSNFYGFEYDQAGRVIKEILPDGREILFSYDSNGNVMSITPPGRPTHSFSYNPVDLMTEYNPPDIGLATDITQYDYNIDRQLTQVSRPDGQAITFTYDTGGRLSSITSPDGPVTYTYDPSKGYLAGMDWPGGNSLSYAYDGILTTAETWGGEVTGSVSWTYDNSFRVTSISVNDANTIGYQYDNDGLITKVGDLTLTRNAQNGFLTGTALGNVSDAWTYNSFGEPTSYIAKYNTTEVFKQEFTYDKLGRIVQKIETVNGETDTFEYAYNLGGNLIEVKKNSTVVASYSYDSNENRLTGPSGTTTYTYDVQDRLITQSSVLGTQSYQYTANGDLMSKTAGIQITQYTYDVFGNLMNVTLPDGTLVEYLADGQNRRIGKKVNGVWDQKFLYMTQLKPVAELDGSNNIVSFFIYGSHATVPDYMVKSGTTYRIVSDHLGSPRLLIDVATGNVVQRKDYDEFGNVLQDTNPGFQPFGFAGGTCDRETGLVRFGARDYDPKTGRWTAKDSLLIENGIPNLYQYALSDPINFVDATGENPLLGIFIGAGFGVGTGYAAAKAAGQEYTIGQALRDAFWGAVPGGFVGKGLKWGVKLIKARRLKQALEAEKCLRQARLTEKLRKAGVNVKELDQVQHVKMPRGQKVTGNKTGTSIW